MIRFIAINKDGKRTIVPGHVLTARDAVTWVQNYCDLSQEPWEVSAEETFHLELTEQECALIEHVLKTKQGSAAYAGEPVEALLEKLSKA